MISPLFTLSYKMWVVCVLQLIVFNTRKGPFYEDFYQCVTHGFYTEPWLEQTYIMMSFAIMFVLPLAVLICTYFSTVFTIASECSPPLSKSKLSPNFLTTAYTNVEITGGWVVYCKFNFMKLHLELRLACKRFTPWHGSRTEPLEIKFYHIDNIIFYMHGTCVNDGGFLTLPFLAPYRQRCRQEKYFDTVEKRACAFFELLFNAKEGNCHREVRAGDVFLTSTR
jgi:hypothetical protein